MKLVLLPGLDGTGQLFYRFIKEYHGDVEVISLPDYASQDYQSLTDSLLLKLPQEPFVVLAESFSGGIATCLLEAKPSYLKGVIFVASFITPPRPLLLFLTQISPLKQLLALPIPNYLLKHFLLGNEASDELIQEFLQIIRTVPDHLLKQRIGQIRTMLLPTINPAEDNILSRRVNNVVNRPVAVIQAADDKLVGQKHSQQLLQRYKAANHYILAGPHFILQAQPKASAELIFRLVSSVEHGSFSNE